MHMVPCTPRNRFAGKRPAPGAATLAAALLVAFIGQPAAHAEDAAPNASATSAIAPAEAKPPLGPVVALTTQWYPQEIENYTHIEDRLLREIVRQGVLIAVRDELGLVTRDETLDELLTSTNADEQQDQAAPSVEGDDAQQTAPPEPAILDVWIQAVNRESWEVVLYGAGATREKPLWTAGGKWNFDRSKVYAEFAALMTDASQPIAAALRTAGAEGEPKPLNPDNIPDENIPDDSAPDDAIETLLGEMNFVSQFAAVRAAHHAVAERGPSAPWLSVLVRGYAHLAMLTDHLWSSQHEAFAARAVLYAERMMRLTDDSDLAKWNRAYAYAVIGAHKVAIKQLDEIAKAEPEPGAAPVEVPAWANLLRPFVDADAPTLRAAALPHDELAQLGPLLAWQIDRSYMNGRWIHDRGIELMQACPEAYNVYSLMANWNALRIERMGASYGMAAFGELLPKRVAQLDDLPAAAGAFTSESSGWVDQLLDVRDRSGQLSARPMEIARALRAAARDDATPDECSWAIIAGLIAEEQFVQAANILEVSQNAVEHSHAELIASLMPLVKEHRYAAFIEHLAAKRSGSADNQPIAATIDVRDPRGNMEELFRRTWNVNDARGHRGQILAWRAVTYHNHTYPALMEAYYGSAADWLKMSAEQRQAFASEFEDISPNWPTGLRLQWEAAEGPKAEQLAKWEAKLTDDPTGWYSLGSVYYTVGDLAGAIRCFEKSIAISPSFAPTRLLAYAYRDAGQPERWLPTLESYLKEPDLSLTHSQIHQLIVADAIPRRAWAEAEPHALEAAQTYSGSSLHTASQVYEGMRNWEQSERYIAEMSRSYPSSSGAYWYFWCRRTGRGDVDAAKKLAESAGAGATSGANYVYYNFVYRVLAAEPAEAVAYLEGRMTPRAEKPNSWSEIYRMLHTLALADELADEQKTTQMLADLRNVVAGDYEGKNADFTTLLDAFCRAAEGAKLDDDALAACDKILDSGDPSFAADFQYFLGSVLDDEVTPGASDRYLRRAAFGGQFGGYGATLAGAKLVKRHGAGRGGVPEEFAEQEDAEAQKFGAKKAKEEAEAAAAGESGEEESAEKDADSSPDSSI